MRGTASSEAEAGAGAGAAARAGATAAAGAGVGPRRVGIVASECYFPSTYVAQSDLEAFHGVSAGKYEKGLGQTKMAFAGPEEDITSMCMGALSNLMERYGLDYKDIGRLEVGTETLVDKSKSTKTSLMALFEGSGNSDVLGVTNVNACYGGTAALFNCVDHMESSAWDGRYSVVICGDVAVYEDGPARPTGGAGVVALLIGPNAPIVLENPLRASHFEDTYDFYKPDLASEYPAVDGHLSNSCYLRAVDNCYSLYAQKFKHATGVDFDMFGASAGKAQHTLFHQPYCKLVQKSFGRLLYNDLKRGDIDLASAELDALAAQFMGVSAEASYTNRELEKACVAASTTKYQEQVFPFTLAGRHLGNSYTGSLYFGLLSLIAQADKTAQGDRVLMFSYGSGLAATMFSAVIDGDLKSQDIGLQQRLEDRQRVSPEDFTKVLKDREQYYGASDFTLPLARAPASHHGASFQLTGVDNLGRRLYQPNAARAATAGVSKMAGSARAMSTLIRGARLLL